MLRSQKRLILLILAVPVVLVLAALAYMVGMTQLEGDPRGFWDSLSWASETLSTTGYGADVSWNHPLMVLLVIVCQFVGVFLVFLIFPIYLIPFLEERFEKRLPTEVRPLANHVVIYRYSAAVATLLDELDRAGVEGLVVEPDENVARQLVGRGQAVLVGRLEDGALQRAHIGAARCLIANGTDDENAAVILTARQLGCTGDILALVEEPLHRQPMLLAGATAAYTPRHALGAALAAQASRRLRSTVKGEQHLGRSLVIREVRVGPGSPIAGQTLAEAGIGARMGVTVVGQWIGGKLQSTPTAATRIAPNGILVLAGSAEALNRFAETCLAGGEKPGAPVVVAGHGEVGRKVAQLLRDAGEPVRVLDRSEPGADVIGDVLDVRVLEALDISNARAVVLALDSDPATLFASVIIRDLAPRVPIIARVNQSENVDRIHAAGADFALSIARVAGQILSRRLLGEEAIALDDELKVLKTAVPRLTGRNPAEAEIRERTGCSVVAVERGDQLIVQLDRDFRFEAEDTAFVAGSSSATRMFLDLFA
jgi:Trk K+ transport system NAD-binding subunit